MATIQYNPKVLQNIVKKAIESWQILERDNLKLSEELHEQVVTFLSENERKQTARKNS